VGFLLSLNTRLSYSLFVLFKSTGTIEHRFEKEQIIRYYIIFFTILQTCFDFTAEAINVDLVAQKIDKSI